jgi:hypothetical protein
MLQPIKCEKCSEGMLTLTDRFKLTPPIVPLYKCDICRIAAYHDLEGVRHYFMGYSPDMKVRE